MLGKRIEVEDFVVPTLREYACALEQELVGDTLIYVGEQAGHVVVVGVCANREKAMQRTRVWTDTCGVGIHEPATLAADLRDARASAAKHRTDLVTELRKVWPLDRLFRGALHRAGFDGTGLLTLNETGSAQEAGS